jgi:lipopolysaccharide export system protein LptC
MKFKIRVKNAFTLIEMMVVLILIISVSFISVTSFQTKKDKQVNVNIKKYLLDNFSYTNSLSFVCLEEEGFPCYIFVDNKIEKDIKIENFFWQKPQVYYYDKQLSDFEFKDYKIENIDYKPIFELNFNKDLKNDNLVVDTNDSKVYLITSITNKVEVFNSTNEILDRFNELEVEVKDAF